MIVARARRGFALAAALAGFFWLALPAPAGRAQTVDVPRPRTFVIGTPPGSRTDRVDAARTGLARTPLPASGLRVEWRMPVGTPVEWGPLVDASGTTYVVGARGDAVAIARDGSERWRVATAAIDPGPSALLSDDTLVFVDAGGTAVGVRDSGVRWRTRIAAPDASRPAPLPLDDGGVVVGTSRELAVLDGDGHERASTVLPEPVTAPLISALGRVVAVGDSGAVWTWLPGGPEPARVGSFGSAVHGGAALADDHTLVAVVAGQTALAAVDLTRGTTITRAVAPGGLWLGPPAMRGSTALVALLGPASLVAVALDPSGRELSRALLATQTPFARPDGGAPGVPPNVANVGGPPLLVDSAGTVAFVTLDGAVGTAVARTVAGPSAAEAAAPRPSAAEAAAPRPSAAEAAAPRPSAAEAAAPRPTAPAVDTSESISDVCTRAGILGILGGGPPPTAGLAPLSPGSLVVACRTGTIVALGGAGHGAPPRQVSGKPKPTTL